MGMGDFITTASKYGNGSYTFGVNTGIFVI